MNNITKSVIKVFGLRLLMLTTRLFVFTVLARSYFYTPHWSLIAAMVLNLHLIGVAAYNCIETLKMYINIRPNIEQVQKDIENAGVKAQNKEYLKKVRK